MSTLFIFAYMFMYLNRGIMTRFRRRIVVAGAVVATAAAGLAVAQLQANGAAAASVSLSGYQLTLPVNSSGKQSGDAATKNPAVVDPPWLTRNPDGSLTFWAPTKGATTPHSQHPRTELVGLTNWSAGAGTHTMTVTERVQQLPPADDIIVGQIHCGGSDSSIPLLMLHYEHTSGDPAGTGQLRVAVRTSPTKGGDDDVVVLTGIQLNASFGFTITESGTGFTVAANFQGHSATRTLPLHSGFTGKDVRFQVGDYQQSDANNSATQGGRLTVTALTTG